MPHGEQFSEKDNQFIKDAIDSVDKPYGDNIIIKKFTGIADPGDPARGIQRRFAFKRIKTTAIITGVSQRDITNSGGIYQLGDLNVSLKQKLNYIDTIQQTGGLSQGDRIIYEGHEYRIVGKVDTEPLIGKNRANVYIIRKIGDD